MGVRQREGGTGSMQAVFGGERAARTALHRPAAAPTPSSFRLPVGYGTFDRCATRLSPLRQCAFLTPVTMMVSHRGAMPCPPFVGRSPVC